MANSKVKFKGFEYEIPEEFTNREMMEIEDISNKSAGEISDGIKKKRLTWGATCAIAYAAMKRAGATVELDELLDASMGDIEIINPPATPATEATPGPLDESASVEQAD